MVVPAYQTTWCHNPQDNGMNVAVTSVHKCQHATLNMITKYLGDKCIKATGF
jgi:hypothetical protein